MTYKIKQYSKKHTEKVKTLEEIKDKKIKSE